MAGFEFRSPTLVQFSAVPSQAEDQMRSRLCDGFLHENYKNNGKTIAQLWLGAFLFEVLKPTAIKRRWAKQ